MNLREGAILQGGKYRIERELGHGGFGITYLATQVGLNRRVAIKEFFMSEYCNRDAETSQVSVGSEGSKELVEKFRKKFIKEAQNIACLKHPHIISIHDVFEDNGTAYYVMEYLEYGSLADLVKRQGRLSEADALRYTRQIADALRYIHERKMNHLDVKPGNILIDETDHAVLIDFGLSKRYDDEGNQTSTTPVGISHGYAPLEQYKKSGVGTFSPATDIYSLGATFYKLVTGTTPPDADDVSEDGLPTLPSYVSSTVASAIEHAMQPRRKDRPQSVDAFMALLEAEVKVEEERTVLDEDLRASLVTPSASQRSARPSINRGTVGSASSHPEGKHQQAPPLFIEGVSVGRGSSKRSAEPTPIWKKLLLPAVACLVVVLAVVLWPKDGDTPVKEEVVTQQSSASSVTTSGNKKTYTVNGVSFTMVRVAGGTFTMGASSGDSEAASDEKPAHQVTLSSYSIGETEVTQALWQAVMGSNPSYFTGDLQRPVETVSWNDCQAFIRKLNAMTGETFRLPTEAEWEYAARGGSHSRGYKYSEPNELGIYDMSDDVYEWCADWYGSYSSSSQTNPKGPSAGSTRVCRGGSADYLAGGFRVSNRASNRADNAPSVTRGNLGLRLVSQ